MKSVILQKSINVGVVAHKYCTKKIVTSPDIASKYFRCIVSKSFYFGKHFHAFSYEFSPF